MWPFTRRETVGAPRIEPVLDVTPAPATTYPLSDPDAWQRLFGPPSTIVTSETARAQSTFYACISLIAGQAAALPCESRALKKAEAETDTPQARLLANPNPRYSRVVFWRQMFASALSDGNGIAWIERRGAIPIALWVIPWNRVGVQFYTAPGGARRLLYHLVLDEGVHIQADQDDVLHIPGSPYWNLFYSVSPVTAYALAVGIALDADKFAQSYFKNSSSPDGYISVAGSLGDKAKADEYREQIRRRFSGDLRFAGPAVLDNGAKYESMRINATDAQLIETRLHGRVEIANIFHVPPHLVNVFDKVQAFGKGLQELNQGFLDYALNPHLDAAEAELTRKLYRPGETRFAQFDRDAFERGDLKSRFEGYQLALGGAQGPGWRSVNEIRLANGDQPFPEPDFDRPLKWGAPAPAKPDSGKSAPDAPQPAGPKGPGKKKGDDA